MKPQTEAKREFGESAQVSFAGPYRLVHLDEPDPETIAQRNRMVEDGTFFDDDCPICQAQKKMGGDIVFEPELEGGEQEAPAEDGAPPTVWRRTYVDVESLKGQSGRSAVHAIATGITFCLLELGDDVEAMGQGERWGESLRHYCACFARYAPALCGSDRLDFAEARNLGALVFQMRSFLGWFAETLPVLAGKCGDLEGVCAGMIEALKRFDVEGGR